MTRGPSRQLNPVPWKRVRIEGGFWGPRVRTNRQVSLPHIHDYLQRTGRIDAWRLQWRPGMPHRPHAFWDSDVAKWLEAAAYSLGTHPDPDLEACVEELVELIASAQQPDGYLNTRFLTVEPENRWANLQVQHELYCAGHLIEAAVALHEALGRTRLRDVLCRYADLIGQTFGTGEGQRPGYPGHEEIELALVRLAEATGQRRYLDLARYFVNQRGGQPHYFDQEARARGEEPDTEAPYRYEYVQAHAPVREQADAVGHAVRAVYLYAAMTDLAAVDGDAGLWDACRRLWASVTERRMYVTGGIGSTSQGEAFTRDYDLPDTTAYAETCAAIGLVFWARRMLHVEPDARYADVMEQALYNGVLAGVSLDGRGFFYMNPLAVDSQTVADPLLGDKSRLQRSEWFFCSCCPPNVARLLASLGGYVYSTAGSRLYAHLYVAGTVEVPMPGGTVRLVQETAYPWGGTVRLTVDPGEAAAWALCLRVPEWARDGRIRINGDDSTDAFPLERGYRVIDRTWRPDDVVELNLPMPVERVFAHPAVDAARGRVALRRGPVVYCVEQADNGPDLDDLILPAASDIEAEFVPDQLGGVTLLRAEALRVDRDAWPGDLYATVPPPTRPERLTAIPYFAWAHRDPGEMRVWIRNG